MLFEVICDEFKQKRIEFHTGLNTVLGNDEGSNSIGKSTFLLIIDFIFGGDDYLTKSPDVQKHISFHTIKFAFIFNNVTYRYSRNTRDSELVFECDENYNKKDEISIDTYKSFLAKEYAIDLTYITFRDIVGRYIRVYGKENYYEKRPLNIVPNEKAGVPVSALLKLFDKYKVIAELQKVFAEKSDNLKIFRKAQKYAFISKINKTQLKKNQEEIIMLDLKKTSLTEKLNGQLLDLDSQLTEQVLKLKGELSLLKRHKSRFCSQLNSLENVTKRKKDDSNDSITKLETFFPGSNLKLISEIEQFHIDITTVLSEEIKQKRNELSDFINMANIEIEQIETKLKEVVSNPNLSTVVLTDYADIIKNIDKLTQENASYKKQILLKDASDLAETRLNNMRETQLNQLEFELNTKMFEMNDIIYSGTKKAPMLTINKNQYTFNTDDDTGTGTSYKGLVVYDLSVLALTQLPILVHDSVVLKQIEDIAIQEILKLYEKAGKQVIISLDKVNSYSAEAEEILNRNAVLHLAPEGNELFGRSWSKTVKTEIE